MLITKRALPRRMFLRGAGAALALPLLDAMVPAASALTRTAANPVRRLGFVYFPTARTCSSGRARGRVRRSSCRRPWRPWVLPRCGHGAVRARQRPGESVGRRHRRPPARRFLVAERHPSAQERGPGRTGRDDHRSDRRGRDRSGHPARFAGALYRASRLDGHLRGQRLQLRLYRLAPWRTPTTPLPAEHNPRNVFDRMFGDGATPEERHALRKRNRSVLDSVTEEIAGLELQIGAQDRVRLTEYLDAVRAIERRIERSEAHSAAMPDADRPLGVPGLGPERTAS